MTRTTEGEPMRLTARTRAERLGEGHVSDDWLEYLLRMRDENTDEYDKVPSSLKMAVGYYESAKKAADPGGGS